MLPLSRRAFIAAFPSVAVPLLIGGGLLAGCGGVDKADSNAPEGDPGDPTDSNASSSADGGWRMPSEEDPHERTWMCWPSSDEVWGRDLATVQDAIVGIAQAIVRFEPVTVLARSSELDALRAIFDGEVDLLEAPVDDLWARDTLPNFVVRINDGGDRELAAAHATFNGWGDKQIHAGDTQLAATVAKQLGVQLFEFGLVGGRRRSGDRRPRHRAGS